MCSLDSSDLKYNEFFFQKGFTTSSALGFAESREILFKIENPFFDSPKGTHREDLFNKCDCQIVTKQHLINQKIF